MPRQFLGMVRVECLKVFSRASGIAALVLSVLVGVCATLVLKELSGWQDNMQFNGQSMHGMMDFDVLSAGRYTLWPRNVVVSPLILLLASAGSVAGEFSDRTLRELVVRPVSRSSVLAAKFVSLATLSAVGLVLCFGSTMAMGWLVLGPPAIDQSVAEGSESLVRLALGFAASLVSDLAVIAIAMALSCFLRSVGGVVVTTVLLLIVDRMLWVILWLASLLGLESAESLMRWTLVTAMTAWDGWESSFSPAQFAYVAVVTALALGAAAARFGRVDVP